MTAVKEAIGAGTTPTKLIDITTVPVETEVACRAASSLALIGPNGVFTDLKQEQRFVPFLGMQVELLVYILTLNPAHRLDIGVPINGCNQDGVVFVAAKSNNVLAVADPVYTRNAQNKVTQVTLFFTRRNVDIPVALGFRVKFEENVGNTTRNNPKRKADAISFNPPAMP
jgi:hypothetical protein